MKFPTPYRPVLIKVSKCHNLFLVWQIANKSNSLYSLFAAIFIIKFDRIGRKLCENNSVFTPIVSHVNENEKSPEYSPF